METTHVCFSGETHTMRSPPTHGAALSPKGKPDPRYPWTDLENMPLSERLTQKDMGVTH